MPLAVAINVAMSFLVNQLGLPVYLDTVGTVLTAVLVGPLAGAVVGALSQALIALQVGTFMLAFIPIQVLIALLAGLAAWRAGFASPGRAIGWGLLVGALAGGSSSVISYWVFAGVTATGVTAITTLLRGLGLTQVQSIVFSSIGTDLLDKTLVFLLVALVLSRFPQRLLGRFPLAARALGR
ncbi:MAG TPA: hypothetical protein VFL95_10805 [Gemmatimonadales bacterium]|nr:hypothetical protein [Gemmatimonadales bacterium]